MFYMRKLRSQIHYLAYAHDVFKAEFEDVFLLTIPLEASVSTKLCSASPSLK